MFKIARFLCVGTSAMLAACTDEPLRAQKMFGPITLQSWAEQEQVTNVQDWHRMARTIADEMQGRGLLPAPAASTDAAAPVSTELAFHVFSDQETPFVGELNRALRTEILRRGGILAVSPVGAYVIHLGANVVVWGSRLASDPGRVRSEAIWYATLNTHDRVLMAVQRPFYIFSADLPNYVQDLDAGPQLARAVRPLRYAQ